MNNKIDLKWSWMHSTQEKQKLGKLLFGWESRGSRDGRCCVCVCVKNDVDCYRIHCKKRKYAKQFVEKCWMNQCQIQLKNYFILLKWWLSKFTHTNMHAYVFIAKIFFIFPSFRYETHKKYFYHRLTADNCFGWMFNNCRSSFALFLLSFSYGCQLCNVERCDEKVKESNIESHTHTHTVKSFHESVYFSRTSFYFLHTRTSQSNVILTQWRWFNTRNNLFAYFCWWCC